MVNPRAGVFVRQEMGVRISIAAACAGVFGVVPLPAADGPTHPAADARPERALTVEELMARRLPNGDDWVTETLHDAAKKQLKRLAHHLADPAHRAHPAMEDLFAPNARLAELRPQGTLTRHFGRMRVVAAPAPSDSASATPTAALAALMRPFGDRGGQRIKFKALRVTPLLAANEFQTSMFYHAYGPSPDGFVEQHALWIIDWVFAKRAGQPQIKRIRPASFSEATSPEPFFRDHTSEVLDGVPAWAQQLQIGVDQWHGATDTLGGVTFLGHQGIAVGDVNGDGLDDIYVAQPAGLPNLLLIHQKDGTVRDVAAASGVDYLDNTRGVLIIDVDNDGDQDLVLALGSTLLVLSNQGKMRFGPLAALHAPDAGDFYSLTAADYDRDGDLDIYATRYVKGRYGVTIPIPWHDANNGPSNHLFRNDGTHFTDVTRQVGLDTNNRRFSLAASWADYDDDGDPDLYVANDFGRNNLYRNDNGSFTDVARESGTEDQAAGMGVSWADVDGDGRLDLHVGNMFSSAGNRIAYQPRFQRQLSATARLEFQQHALGNALFRNSGDGTFVDVSEEAGIRMGRWSWGPRFADLDSDGLPDILSPNGFITNTLEDDL